MRRLDVVNAVNARPNVRRGILALGAALLPAAAAAQQGVGGSSTTPRTTMCGPGGMMLRPTMRAGVVGGGWRDSLAERRAVELERMARTGLRSGAAVGDRVRIDRVRGWMGLGMSELSETRLAADGRYVRYCDYPVVVSVEPASPAQRAGIEAGDTIVAYNGVDLRSGAEIALDRLLVPDDTLRVGVRRDGHTRVLPVIIGRRQEAVTTQVWSQTTGPGESYRYVIVSPSVERAPRASLTLVSPEAPPPPAPPIAASELSRARAAAARRTGRDAPTPPAAAPAPMAPVVPVVPMVLAFGYGGPSAIAGAQLIALDADLGAAVGAKTGVLVLRVAERTPADEAGLRPGDVITLAGGRQVTSPAMVQQALLRGFDERAVALRVVRKGKAREITLRW